MNKLNTRKGFTLLEMLVVVGIIAILVGISIPIFSTQLEKAREAVCLANARNLLGVYRTEELVNFDETQRESWMTTAAEKCEGEYDAATRHVSGLCSDDEAYYTISYGNNNYVTIVCSKHGDIIQKYVDGLAKKMLSNIVGVYRDVQGKDQYLTDYMRSRTVADSQINSENPIHDNGALTWPMILDEKIGGIDQSWALRLVEDRNPNAGYVLAVTTSGKLNSESQAGDEITVRYYTFDKNGEQISVENRVSSVNISINDGNHFPSINMDDMR